MRGGAGVRDAVRAEAALPPVVFVDERHDPGRAARRRGRRGDHARRGGRRGGRGIVEAALEERRAPPSRPPTTSRTNCDL